MSNITRRQALARIGAFLAVGGLGIGNTRGETTSTLFGDTKPLPAAPPPGSFSIAHITDVHITDEMDAVKWVSKCLQQIQSHKLDPQFILNTGDSVMDSARQDRARSEHYWKIWNDTLKNELSLPMRSVLGNHDVWGVRLDNDDPILKDPMFGKKLGQERLGIEKLYYSFDHGNWHFVMLDSVIHQTKDYGQDWVAGLDDEQFKWLKQDLASIPKDKYVVVNSHLPILQVVSMRNAQPTENGTYELGPKNMFTDARRVIDLFAKHPNVKLCLSGHTHNRDYIQLEDTTYICGGSVCGSKWKAGTRPDKMGYSMVTLHPDGNFDYAYESYGWHPPA